MSTLLLDADTWDLTLDAAGNLALAPSSYALAQDVASEARLFLGELWYDVTRGVPYRESVLGRPVSPGFLRAQLLAAAARVPGVTDARCFLAGVGANRLLRGQIQVRDAADRLTVVQMNGELPWYVRAVEP